MNGLTIHVPALKQAFIVYIFAYMCVYAIMDEDIYTHTDFFLLF